MTMSKEKAMVSLKEPDAEPKKDFEGKMHKEHRITKCFLPVLTVLYVVIFTLLIGMITGAGIERA